MRHYAMHSLRHARHGVMDRVDEAANDVRRWLLFEGFEQRCVRGLVEPMTGIEPAYSAWEAFSRPERLFQNARSAYLSANSNTNCACGFGPVGVRLRYGSSSRRVRSRRGSGLLT